MPWTPEQQTAAGQIAGGIIGLFPTTGPAVPAAIGGGMLLMIGLVVVVVIMTRK